MWIKNTKNKLPRGRAPEVFTTNSQIFIYNLWICGKNSKQSFEELNLKRLKKHRFNKMSKRIAIGVDSGRSHISSAACHIDKKVLAWKSVEKRFGYSRNNWWNHQYLEPDIDIICFVTSRYWIYLEQYLINILLK